MINMKLIQASQAVIDACDSFSGSCLEKMPRIQEREMMSITKALRELAGALDTKNPQFGIGTFPIDNNGQRVFGKDQAPVGIAHLVYIPEQDKFGAFWTTPPIRAEDGSVGMVPIIPGIREITLTEMVEMGYAIPESVTFIRKLAEHLSFDAYAKAATGPSGLA